MHEQQQHRHQAVRPNKVRERIIVEKMHMLRSSRLWVAARVSLTFAIVLSWVWVNP